MEKPPPLFCPRYAALHRGPDDFLLSFALLFLLWDPKSREAQETRACA